MSIEGSKPRKYTKKTNHFNPTLASFNVTSLFNPELYHYHQMIRPNPTARTVKNTQDMLSRAEVEFSASRVTERMSPVPQEKNRSSSLIEKPAASLERNPSSVQEQPPSHYRQLNYLNSESIKRKQLHGYNILSGF